MPEPGEHRIGNEHGEYALGPALMQAGCGVKYDRFVHTRSIGLGTSTGRNSLPAPERIVQPTLLAQANRGLTGGGNNRFQRASNTTPIHRDSMLTEETVNMSAPKTLSAT